MSGSTKTGSYSVDIEGDIAGNEYIAIVPYESFTLSSTNLASVTATINQDKKIGLMMKYLQTVIK